MDAPTTAVDVAALRHLADRIDSTPERDAVDALVLDRLRELLGAQLSLVALRTRDDRELTVTGVRGVADGAVERWSRFPDTADLPMGAALRTGRTVVLDTPADVRERFPAMVERTSLGGTLIFVPLTVGDTWIGGLTYQYAEVRRPAEVELTAVREVADAYARVVQRLQAIDRARESSKRLALLAEASAELASSLDYRATLANVAHLAVRTVADWCGVDILDDSGVLRNLAVAHVDADRIELAHRLQREYPADPAATTGAPQVARSGRSELWPEITDEMLVASAQDDAHLTLLRELGLRSVMTVPLVSRGHVLGVLNLVSSREGRRYTGTDLAVAEDLANRAAVAIDNAELYSETRQVAIRLREAIVPATTPDVPGWDVAGSYRPAGRTELGGDFYDVVPQPDGRFAVVIGDVMGRGVAAAASMAQLRAALRAYVVLDPDPAVVLSRLDAMFARYGGEQFVTIGYGLVAADGRSIEVCRAGHPPALLVAPDASATFLEGVAGPPVGVGAPVRTATRYDVPAGGAVMLYSDGLIERRTEDLDVGLERLRAAAGDLATGHLTASLRRLVTGLSDPVHHDDVSAIVVRRRR